MTTDTVHINEDGRLVIPVSFVLEVHALARSKGFWDGCDPGELVPGTEPWAQRAMLLMTEVAEAYEEVRAGNLTQTTDEKGKPLGLPSELADIVIRALDMSVGEQGVPPWQGPLVLGAALLQVNAANIHQRFLRLMATCNGDFRGWRLAVMRNVFAIARYYQIDLAQAIMAKHEYNKTRPHKNGKLF